MSNHNPPKILSLASEKLTADHKVFLLDLKENEGGRFIKITEDIGGYCETIMIPMFAAKEFHALLGKLLEIEATLQK